MAESQNDAARFASPEDIDNLVARFRNLTLPYEAWTHAAHLAVGMWHVTRYGQEEATERLRNGIRQYNVACGIDNTESSGYHETITLFYIQIIRHYLESQNEVRPLHDLVNELVDSPNGSRRAPLDFYSRDHLFSVQARRH